MSHLFLTAIGSPSVAIALLDVPDRALAADELRVAVEAAPINNADLLFAAGWFSVVPQVPAEMGAEGVGRVLAAGSDLDPDVVGRRVVILPTFVHGTWGHEVTVPARHTVVVPDGADPLQLAMLAVNPATARALLTDYAALEQGDWIGLNLANSAVGLHVIALARRAGIRTVAIVRREEVAERVRERGADVVLVDGEDLGSRVADALDGARLRLFLDGTGDSRHIAELTPNIEPGGSLVVFAAASGQAPALPLADLIYRGVSLRAFFILNWIRDTPREELEQAYAELADLVGDGVLRTDIEAGYPLETFHQALEHAAKEGRSGKVLFTPGTDGGRTSDAGPVTD